MADLGKITVPPAPRPENDLKAYQRNVEIYTRQVEQAFRQVEAVLADMARRISALENQ